MLTNFDAWVANTIQSLGGNGGLYLQGLQRKRALTYAGTRADACQGGFVGSGKIYFLDSMRPAELATTNKQAFSQKHR